MKLKTEELFDIYMLKKAYDISKEIGILYEFQTKRERKKTTLTSLVTISEIARRHRPGYKLKGLDFWA